MNFNLITILGPTAAGKTQFAAQLAAILKTEIISADSRQVYKRMNIGTGKDYDDYFVNGEKISYHLIDILEAGEQYSVFNFVHDFFAVYQKIAEQGKTPILCGGTGMYIESVLKNYYLPPIIPNLEFRSELEKKDNDELIKILSSLKKLHNTTDILDRNALIKAVEIAHFYHFHPEVALNYPKLNSFILGISFEREIQRQRITERLKFRLENGMLEEVKNLIESVVKIENLLNYGLEYKFVTQYLLKNLTYAEMFEKLNIAIHQFAKRQMTWFRKMERDGFQIHWLDGSLSLKEKLEKTISLLKNENIL